MQELLVRKYDVEWNLLSEPDGLTGHWITAEELGRHLGYSEPRKNVMKIHERHAEVFKDNIDTGVVKLTTAQGVQETRIFSERGALKVIRYSNTDVADQIMDQVFDIFLSVKDALIKEDIVVKAQRELEAIRKGEQETFEKIKAAIALASDYKEKFSSIDFAILQNILHRAVTGMTAVELKLNRANAGKLHIGMQVGYDYGKHGQLLYTGTQVVKNYLTKEELLREARIGASVLIGLECYLDKKQRLYNVADIVMFIKQRIALDAFFSINQDMLPRIPVKVIEQTVNAARQTYNQTTLADRGFQMFLVETGRDDLPLFPLPVDKKILEMEK